MKINLAQYIKAFFIIVTLNFPLSQVGAELIPDKTLGNESSTLNPIDEQNLRVDQGARRESNLFHSFQEFNIQQGQSVYFGNPTGVERIFLRVTGTNRSEILGKLGVLGNADLFFLNPNGIRFGPRASLELSGSFLATTANTIRFADGHQFNASNPQQGKSRLTVNVPIALGFYQLGSPIQFTGGGHNLILTTFGPTIPFPANSILRVNSGENLTLMAGDIRFDGGVVAGQNVTLAAVKQGEVSLDVNNPSWNFDFAQVEKRGNINLSNFSAVDSPGVINLQGRQITIESGSLLLSQNELDGGVIKVDADSLTLQGFKASGFLSLSEGENLQNDPQGIIFDLETGKTRGGLIEGVPILPGQEVEQVLDQFNLAKESFNFSYWYFPSNMMNVSLGGRGGQIHLELDSLTIFSGANINLRNFGNAAQGQLVIKAHTLEISGYIEELVAEERVLSVFSSVNVSNFGIGEGAKLRIDADQIRASDGGNIAATSFNSGKVSSISIRAEDIWLSGYTPGSKIPSGINSSPGNMGDSYSIDIEAARIQISDGAGIFSNVSSAGDGGNIEITATELLKITGNPDNLGFSSTSIVSGVFFLPENLTEFYDLPRTIRTGNSGAIIINTPRLEVSQQALITVENEGIGNAGNLSINAEEISLTSGSTLSATSASGKGGNILLNSHQLLLDQGLLTTTSEGIGNGGNIFIDSQIVILNSGSRVSANAVFGNGGNIEINASGFLASPDSQVTATSEFGVDGNVEINTNVDDLRKVLATRREIFIPEQRILETGCEIQLFDGENLELSRNFPKSDNSIDYSGLISTTIVDTPLDIPVIEHEFDELPPIEGMPIVPATTMARTPSGKLILINEARLTNNSPKFPATPSFCSRK